MDNKQHLCSNCLHIGVCIFFAEFVRCLSMSEKLNVLDMAGIISCRHHRAEGEPKKQEEPLSDDLLQEKLNALLEPAKGPGVVSAMAKKIDHETECVRCGSTYELNDTDICSACGIALCPDCVIVDMESGAVFCEECYDKKEPSLS